MTLLIPTRRHLPAHIRALRLGWSPDTDNPRAGRTLLDEIARDPDDYLTRFDERTPDSVANRRVTLRDGSVVPRLPNIRFFIWHDDFCGQIALRWQPGTHDLPPTCAGHVGYSVPGWHRGCGIATAALEAVMGHAPALGFRHLDVTVAPWNSASRRVIEKAGGRFLDLVRTPAALGRKDLLRYRLAV